MGIGDMSLKRDIPQENLWQKPVPYQPPAKREPSPMSAKKKQWWAEKKAHDEAIRLNAENWP